LRIPLLASTNLTVLDSFLPILIFPQTMAPKFENGFPSILSFALIAVCFMRKFPVPAARSIDDVAKCPSSVFADFMHKRQLKQEEDKATSQPAAELPIKAIAADAETT
jgi:MFS transporter, ACS family, pantothenate transporter